MNIRDEVYERLKELRGIRQAGRSTTIGTKNDL